MSILFLPNEVLSCIFQYLPFADRAVLARTCKTLYRAHLSAECWNNVTLTLEENDFIRAINTLKSSPLIIRKLTFKSVDMQVESISGWKEFWDNIGHDIYRLEYRGCDISERTFFSILHKCPNMKLLVIENCNSLLMSGKLLDNHIKFSCDVPQALLFLTGLDLSNNRYLSDALFNKMVSFSKNLERLSLAGCQISFHGGIFKRFYPKDGSVTASESVLTFQNIVKFIERQSAKLKCLNFSVTHVDDDALDYMSRIPNLNLEELYLVKCAQITKRGIEAFCSRQPHLRVMNVSECLKLDVSAVSSIMLYGHEMVTLNLSKIPCLTDDVVARLVDLPHIRQLNLSSCTKLTSAGICSTLCCKPLENLVGLHLAECSFDQDALITIVSQLTRLQHLDLERCRLGTTNRTLHAISRNLHRLRVLNIARCPSVTDVGLTGCYYKLPVLKPKTLTMTSPVANGRLVAKDGSTIPAIHVDAQIDAIIDQEKSLSQLSCLQKLSLSGCSEITDVGLNVAIRFPELTMLDLSDCPKITDSGLFIVAASNRSLETVILSHCSLVTDDGIMNIAKLLPRLKHLDIQGCFKVANVTFEVLRKYCPDLRHFSPLGHPKSAYRPPFFLQRASFA